MRKKIISEPIAFVLVLLGIMGPAGCENSTFYAEESDAGTEQDAAVDAPVDNPTDAAPDSPPDAPVEDSADPCNGVTCSGHGTCASPGGVAVCNCETGYRPEGLTCIEDPCSGVICGDNAHCSAGACVCDTGYEGDPYAGCTSPGSEEERVRNQLVEIALAEIGYCEGVDDRPYMLDQPGFWCYDFVAWVYEQSDYTLPEPLGLPTYTVGSLSPGWRPEPGDLIKFVIQHYGMVAQVSADGLAVTTVEGNYGSCVVSRTIYDSEVEYYGSLDSVF